MSVNQVTVTASNIENFIIFYKTLGLKLIVKTSHYGGLPLGFLVEESINVLSGLMSSFS